MDTEIAKFRISQELSTAIEILRSFFHNRKSAIRRSGFKFTFQENPDPPGVWGVYELYVSPANNNRPVASIGITQNDDQIFVVAVNHQSKVLNQPVLPGVYQQLNKLLVETMGQLQSAYKSQEPSTTTDTNIESDAEIEEIIKNGPYMKSMMPKRYPSYDVETAKEILDAMFKTYQEARPAENQKLGIMMIAKVALRSRETVSSYLLGFKNAGIKKYRGIWLP